MSSDGPTLDDDSFASAKAGGTHAKGHGHTHRHGGGPAHSHPLTAGQEAHVRGRRWAEHDRGGHFPAVAEPDLLAETLRAVFRSMRRH